MHSYCVLRCGLTVIFTEAYAMSSTFAGFVDNAYSAFNDAIAILINSSLRIASISSYLFVTFSFSTETTIFPV